MGNGAPSYYNAGGFGASHGWGAMHPGAGTPDCVQFAGTGHQQYDGIMRVTLTAPNVVGAGKGGLTVDESGLFYPTSDRASRVDVIFEPWKCQLGY